MTEIEVLNSYGGIGGNRKHWEGCRVTTIELDPKIAAIYSKMYPEDTVIIADAHQYLLEHYQEFDFIWSSPPCQSHSKMDIANYRNKPRYPDMRLHEETIFLKTYFKGKYVVENVRAYYGDILNPKRVGRHNFWTNFEFEAEDVPRPKDFINTNTLSDKGKLMEWLGIHYDGNVYYNGNHCPLQVLRNCVHPLLGEQIYKVAMDLIQNPKGQKSLI